MGGTTNQYCMGGTKQSREATVHNFRYESIRATMPRLSRITVLINQNHAPLIQFAFYEKSCMSNEL